MKCIGMLTVVLAISATALVVCHGEVGEASASTKPKWEYKVLSVYEVADVDCVFDLLHEDTKNNSTPSEAEPRERTADASVGESQAAPAPGLEEVGKAMASLANKRVAEGLDRIGEAGWELVAVEGVSFFFKRQRD